MKIRRTGCRPWGFSGTATATMLPGLIHDVRGFPTQRADEILAFRQRLFRKIRQHLDDIQLMRTELAEDAQILVAAYGSVARSARRAVREARELGVKAGLLHLQTLWPFPGRLLQPYFQGAGGAGAGAEPGTDLSGGAAGEPG